MSTRDISQGLHTHLWWWRCFVMSGSHHLKISNPRLHAILSSFTQWIMCCPCAISIQKNTFWLWNSFVVSLLHLCTCFWYLYYFSRSRVDRYCCLKFWLWKDPQTELVPHFDSWRYINSPSSFICFHFTPHVSLPPRWTGILHGSRQLLGKPGKCRWGEQCSMLPVASCYVMLCKPALSATSVDHIHLAFTLDFSFTPSSLSCSQTSAIGRHNIIRDISNSRSIRRALHTRGNMYVHGEAPSVLHPGKNDRKTIIRHQLPRGPTHGHHVTLGLNTSTYSIRSHSVSVYCLVAFRGSHKEMSAKYNS